MEEKQNKPEKKNKRNKKATWENVKKNMEFYFSDAALTKDRFLGKLVESDPQGFVPLDVFLTFNKIKSITQKISDLVKGVLSSNELELDEDKKKVRRKVPLQPYDVDSRTIYVESIPANGTIDSLTDIFQAYGTVAYVSLPKYSNTGKIKGFAFVEFKTSDDAKKCIEEFTAMGCKLPNSVTAEELLTCSTYKQEDATSAEKDAEDSDSLVKNKSKRVQPADDLNSSESSVIDEPPSKKPKVTSSTVSEPSEKAAKSSAVKRGHEESTEEIVENPSPKKSKTKSTETHGEGDILDEKPKPDAPESEENEDNSEVENTETEEPGKTKPVRKRNKKIRKKKLKSKEKQKIETAARSLQVLSKAEWKVLRNKYLNMQRNHMKALKRVLRTRHTLLDNTPNLGGNEAEQNIDKKPVIKTPAAIQFTEGVIIAVNLPEPCVDVKNFKKSTKANVHVKYVDIKEGQTKAHVRFDKAEFAKQFATSGVFSDCSILGGQEEKDYWEELTRLQSTEKRKIRGRNRLVNKAQELAAKCGHRTPLTHPSKHIRFDD